MAEKSDAGNFEIVLFLIVLGLTLASWNVAAFLGVYAVVRGSIAVNDRLAEIVACLKAQQSANPNVTDPNQKKGV